MSRQTTRPPILGSPRRPRALGASVSVQSEKWLEQSTILRTFHFRLFAFLMCHTILFSMMECRQDSFDRSEKRILLIFKKLKNISQNLYYSRLFCDQPRFLNEKKQRILSGDVILASLDKNQSTRIWSERCQDCRLVLIHESTSNIKDLVGNAAMQILLNPWCSYKKLILYFSKLSIERYMYITLSIINC